MFCTRDAIAKISNLLITELFYSHIWTELGSLHTTGFPNSMYGTACVSEEFEIKLSYVSRTCLL